MNISKLLEALEDDTNESLLNMTTNKISEINLKILKELNLSKKNILEISKKLKGYKYIDEMNDLKYGTYIRWIPLNDPTNIVLTKGAIFCEIKITDEGTCCICKNFGFHSRYFQIMLDENLIFQKLTDQEHVLLSALDHLSK